MPQLNEKHQMMQQKQQVLETIAITQINAWKSQLDGLLNKIKLKISQAFLPYEQSFQKERGKLYQCEQEGHKHQDKIHEVLDLYTAEIAQNPNYIAYGLFNTDILNENSVEYLNSQTEIWQDQVTNMLQFQGLSTELETEYESINIVFDKDMFNISDKLFKIEDMESMKRDQEKKMLDEQNAKMKEA